MMRHLCLFTAASFLLAAAPLCADDSKGEKATALDIIASDARGAIAIRNASELTKSGDELIDKAEIKSTMRISEAYGWLVTFVGLSRGLDNEGAAALMLFKADPDVDAFVLAVPVADA